MLWIVEERENIFTSDRDIWFEQHYYKKAKNLLEKSYKETGWRAYLGSLNKQKPEVGAS